MHHSTQVTTRSNSAQVLAMDTSSHMSCVLKINMQTRGWEKSMHKLIKDIPDVTYMIDAAMGLAYVSGKINPEIILKIRKCKKHVQLIHIDYGHNLTPRSTSYYLPTTTTNGFNQPQPPTPMSQAVPEPYMHYLQIPYEQPQVAYPYFNPYL